MAGRKSRDGARTPRAVTATHQQPRAARGDTLARRAARAGPLGAFVLGSAAFNLWAVHVGWWHTLLDEHGFRQTHTAISVWRLLEGGPWVAYETPVLGPPWSIPLEFPLYQWLVALAVRLFGGPLDQTGRAVSLVSFYASVPAAYTLLRRLRVVPAHAAAVIGLWLLSPQYIFWSRTCMIEMAAVCLGLWYLVAVTALVDEPGPWRAALVAACGSLAGLIKLTTVPAFMLAAAVWSVACWWRRRPAARQCVLVFAATFVVPLAVTAVWTRFADGVRASNPLARTFLLASELNAWNFGTFAQRSSAEFWSVLALRTVPDAVGHWGVVGGATLLTALASQRWRETLVCVVLFLAAPLIFTNLHIVHNYYACANALFLVGGVGLAIVAGLEAPGWRRYVGSAAFVMVGALEVNAYLRGYYLAQQHDRRLPAAEMVAQVTDPNDVVLIYGGDWSSVLPYYARRRALMDRSNRSFDDPAMHAALEGLREYTIGAAVFCGATTARADLIRQSQRTFTLQTRPVRAGGCEVYPRVPASGASGEAEHG